MRQTELNIELFHETTAHRPDEGIIIYGLAENYERLTLHRVERRPAIFIEMLGKAAAAFDARSAAAVTAEGVVTKQCVICPYRSRCPAAQMHAIPAAGTGGLDQATLRSMDRLIAALPAVDIYRFLRVGVLGVGATRFVLRINGAAPCPSLPPKKLACPSKKSAHNSGAPNHSHTETAI